MPTDDSEPAGRGGIEIRSPTAIFEDERAIEGLPIRLVIALLVGVAALSVMMQMIDDAEGIGKTELDAEPEPNTIDLGTDGTKDVTITVVDGDGSPVSGATVILSGESARLPNGPYHGEAEDGEVTFEGISPELEANQDQGTLSIDVQHPDGDYEDERDNNQILVFK